MKKKYFSILLLSLLSSCNFSGVKQKEDSEDNQIKNSHSKPAVETAKKEDATTKVNQPVRDTLFLDNGIYIAYKQHGSGSKIKTDDVVLIDYTCKLPNGKVFDSNKKLGKPIPFLVGWDMQTLGWDIAFPLLREGDEVIIYLPSKMARGEKGIPNLVPPNSPNIIALKIDKILKPTYSKEGVQTWVVNRGDKMPQVQKGDNILIDYFAYSKSFPRYDNSFKNGQPYQMTVGAKNNMEGLNIGIENAQLSDKLWVMIPPDKAFGTKGYLNYVAPNESVFFSLRVLKILNK